MKVIIETEKVTLDKLVHEYKQNHMDDFSPDECRKYVRRKIINAAPIDKADIRIFYSGENYVTW